MKTLDATLEIFASITFFTKILFKQTYPEGRVNYIDLTYMCKHQPTLSIKRQNMMQLKSDVSISKISR